VAMVWRGETGQAEVLGNGLGREYGELGPKDVTGTADVVMSGYRALEVWDYKTGKSVPEPQDSAQLKHLAMMAVKALRPMTAAVVAGFQRIRFDLRKKKDQVTVRDVFAVYGREDLDMHERRLKRALVVAERVRDDIAAGREPEVKEGSYCFFCPARLECPAKKGKR
jgi:RecB family exonuclease